MVSRKLPLPQFFIDANCINALGRDDNLNQLEKWDANGVISIRLPQHAQIEVEAAGAKQRQKAWNRLVPYACITTADERTALQTIEKIISRNGGLSKNDEVDALNVFTAWKYSRAILVTSDGRLVRNAEAFMSAIGAQVMSPSSAVELVRRNIGARDRMAIRHASNHGLPIPVWVGID